MCDCSDSITNGAPPVAATVGPNLTLSNLYAGNVFTNFINVSYLQINSVNGAAGQVLTATGTGSQIYWSTPSGGSGSSQWTTIGFVTPNPIYYSNSVGIGSTAVPTATLMVTGNIYASNSLTTTNVIATRFYGDGGFLSNIASGGFTQPLANLAVSNSVTTTNLVSTSLVVTGAMTSNVTNTTLFYDTLTIPYVNTLQLTAPSIISIGGVSSFSNLIVSNLQVTNTLNASNLFGAANLTTLNVSTLAATTANITTLNVTGAVTFSNVSGNGAGLTSLNASNITTGILSSARIYGNTLGNISGSNVTTGINASNITTGILSSVRIYGNTLSNIQSSNITQPLANLVVSNTVTTSEIICNAFTTSTATNWNYISNAASARSTSVGWQGIRQVFGDHITSNVYVYNNAVLETTLSYIASGFGAFVAVGGVNDAIIVVSGVDAFYIYYFDGLIWNGPNAVNTTPYLGTNNTLWMPSLSVVDTSIKLVIGGYGWVSAAGGGNPGVGVYNIRLSDGSAGFFGEITPYNSVGTLNRNTVAISGDGTTIAIGQQDSSILYVYSITDLLTPVFYDSTDPGDEYYVSIDYYGQIILLTLNGSVRMYSISLTPV